MFPNSFEYIAPKTLMEAIELLKQHGYDAKVVAGGQSLLPMMKLRVAAPSILIDINNIDELKGWRNESGYLRIGALTRHADLEHSEELREQYPLLAETAVWIADPLVRNLGTVCGSLAHADPGSDWGAAMLALHAQVEVAGPEGKRQVPIDDFFVDTFTPALEETEIVTAVLVPTPVGRVGGRYLKIERKAGDFAIAGLAVHVSLASDGTVAEAGFGICACGPIPLRGKRAEEYLLGKKLTPETIEAASRLVPEDAEPADDLRGSAEYKRDVLRVFAKRGLSDIAKELQGEVVLR
ncbi:FAD binding domain-containing protein [Thermoflavimicrobium dichotomicum]|uniref:Carbon-monoxide dehydrogenase medium subunit n=1 Tax=Thermoflavimicrobium dichotomicum TaxID=46223 RepID=A0A1I3KG36_9BACL|nr:xanthine dehydrogenase family protein subunit M [Thermoflavimicrobium dichotomicum]SFI71413.1 carbon-monoxide dehydrogenase medium subunit [Thermoflavimicrobium dichotomicum]